mgnify:CR=1 FL=1
MDSAVEIRERKEKHRSQYQRQKKKQQRLQFGKLETDGSLKKERKLRLETDGGHFRQRRMMFYKPKKGSRNIAENNKTYQEVDKAARKQEAERQNKIPKDSVYTKKTNEEQKAKVKYHLYFDKKTGKTDGKKKTLSSVPKKALKNAVYQKAGEDEEENSAVDAAHKLVRSGEWILQEHSSRNIRRTAVRYIKKTV